MSRSWLKIGWKIGALVFVVITAAYINYQRTTFGEVSAEKLLEARNDLHLAALNMKDGVSYAEFTLSERAIAKVNSGGGFKALEAVIYKVYCEQNIEQANKLKITHLHANIFTEKHDLILSRILSPKHCT